MSVWSKNQAPPPIQTAFLILVWLAWALFYVFKGPQISVDTMTYASWSKAMIDLNFNPWEFINKVVFKVSPLHYLFWIYLVSLNMVFFGAYWTWGILICNMFAGLWIFFCCRRILSGLSNILVSGWGLLIASLFCYELFSWMGYVLSDLVFTAIITSTLLLLCAPTGRNASSLKTVLAGILVVLALFFRPSAPPILALFISLLFQKPWLLAVSGRARAKRAVGWLSLCAICAIVGTLVFAWFLQDPGRWPFGFARDWVYSLAREAREGYVVFDRPETYHASPKGLAAYAWLMADRYLHFFALYAADFSMAHKVINSAFFGFVFITGGYASALVILRPEKFKDTAWWAGWSCILLIVYWWVFQSIQQIDFDWRYRLPVIPAMIILSCLGFEKMWLSFRGR